MRLLIAALLFSTLQVFASTEGSFNVQHGEIRQPMPGRTVTAGYFTLHNLSTQDVSLNSISSEAFARAELHQHSHKDGMMRMEQLDHIVIPAGQRIELAPGGLHLMLFDPTTELQIGQTIKVLLHFADGQQLMLALPVVAMPKR
jgi:periplasmic copper chaperone A